MARVATKKNPRQTTAVAKKAKPAAPRTEDNEDVVADSHAKQRRKRKGLSESRKPPIRCYLTDDQHEWVRRKCLKGKAKSKVLQDLVEAEMRRESRLGGHTEVEQLAAYLLSGKEGKEGTKLGETLQRFLQARIKGIQKVAVERLDDE